MNDYISREGALNLIACNDKVCHYADERCENVVCATTQTICKAVAEMPAADVQPVKRGRWIKQDGFWSKNTVKCSLCGNYLDMNGVNGGRSDANFCPNCGAEMKGESICY